MGFNVGKLVDVEDEEEQEDGLLGLAKPPIHEFTDTSLKRAYSIHVHKNLLAAAGKDGRASMFVMKPKYEQPDEMEAVMSAKLHGGWIADIQFLDRQEDDKVAMPIFLYFILLQRADVLWYVSDGVGVSLSMRR